MAEWNAAVYHRVSNPQLAWGLPVLERLPLSGGECVLDVGCGTGRLTERLLARLPRGRAVAIDRSQNMLLAARDHLTNAGRSRVSFVLADAAALPFSEVADAVFSTATFHWVLDHDRLFASLFRALKRGGRLVAQCGGGPNLARVHARCGALMAEAEFREWFPSWSASWEFADAATTAARLERAGFGDVRTSVEAAPVLLGDAGEYREFVEHVVLRPHLARIADPRARARFLDRITEAAALDDPPFELDYWRLNLDAGKPERP